jgi:hypothetical protein
MEPTNSLGTTVALITIALSLIGNIVNFIFTFRERRSKSLVGEASAQKIQGESYSILVESLVDRIESLGSELDKEIKKRRELQEKFYAEVKRSHELEQNLEDEIEKSDKCSSEVALLSATIMRLEKRLAILESTRK